MIKPHRSFTSPSLPANFPGIKALFHADDFVSGTNVWVARHGGLTLTMNGNLTKDAVGIYTAATNTVASVTGTMPTLSKYAVVVGIGKLQTGSAAGGTNTTFGSASGNGLLSNGIAYSSAVGGEVGTQPSLTGSITAASKAASVGYFDLVDTTSPAILRALGSATTTDTAIPNGSATTDFMAPPGSAIGVSTLSQGVTCSALTTASNGARIKVMALFDFLSPMILSDIQLAAAEMARTQELYAGWRNRAAA